MPAKAVKTEEFTGMDLLVSFDTTGSMYPVLSQVRKNVVSFVKDMFNSIDNLRVGIIAHGDYCDKDNPYTIRVMDFTEDEGKICDFVRNTAKTYGGDADECYELVLRTARTIVDWRPGRKKVFVLIGDASPHSVNYRDNTDRIDWRDEAHLLNEMGVQIFAVHALSYYRSSSKDFYSYIAKETNGTYLTLDHFDEITLLIKATCMAEYSETKLNDFISIIKSTGKMTRTMAKNMNRLSGKEVVSSGEFVGADGLVPVTPGRFQVFEVDTDCPIKNFVESNGIEFKRGRGFYELTKHETVQQYKEVIIQDRETGDMFTGKQVREKLGLQPQVSKGGVKESLSSRDTVKFRVFVQSTSFNRKLIGGTTFLYEVSDLDYTGTTVSTEDISAAKAAEPKKAEPKKAEAKKVETKKVKESTKKTKEVGEVKKAEPKKTKKTPSKSSETTSTKPKKASLKSRKSDETKIDAAVISGDYDSKLPPLPVKSSNTPVKKETRKSTRKPNHHDEEAQKALSNMKEVCELITSIDETKLTSKGKKYMKDIRDMASKLVTKE